MTSTDFLSGNDIFYQLTQPPQFTHHRNICRALDPPQNIFGLIYKPFLPRGSKCPHEWVVKVKPQAEQYNCNSISKLLSVVAKIIITLYFHQLKKWLSQLFLSSAVLCQ